MPEENLEASSIETEQTVQTESAPVEENTSEPDVVENVTSEKTTNTAETTEEKMVPLSALQQERQKRKESEAYIKALQASYQESGDDTDSTAPNADVMTRSEYEFREREKTNWQKAEETFPELRDPEIRELAEARRERELVKNQKYLTVEEAARLTVDILKRTRSEGQKAAQESVSIQKREQIESSGSNNSRSDSDNLVEVIRNSDNNEEKKAALFQLLKKQ